MGNKITTKLIIAILLGTALEWYDFSLIGSMAVIISPLFFPSHSSLLSLIGTFGVFATGFLARPLGASIFGHFGDTKGRRHALSSTILIMAIPTTCIGMLPIYNSIGIAAPILLIFFRLMQGVASSGEYPGAICYLYEIAPKNKKGICTCISMIGTVVGILSGTICCWLITTLLNIEQINSWGWRLPFLIGLPLGVVGQQIRKRFKESSEFLQAIENNEIIQWPLFQLLSTHPANLFKIIFLFSVNTTYFYMIYIYLPNYLVNAHKITFSQSILFNSAGLSFLTVMILICGYVSDKFNKIQLILTGTYCLLIFTYPIYYLMIHMYQILFIWQMILSIPVALFAAPLAAFTAESFFTPIRYSGISLGLNIGASIFGGTYPLIATSLGFYTNTSNLACFYPMSFAFISTLILRSNYFTIYSSAKNY